MRLKAMQLAALNQNLGFHNGCATNLQRNQTETPTYQYNINHVLFDCTHGRCYSYSAAIR